MRGIYLIIFLVLLVGAYFFGFHMASRNMVPIVSLDSVRYERDKLTLQLQKSQEKVEALKEYAIIQAGKAEESDQKVKQLEKEKAEQGKQYAAKIRAIQTYDSTQLDDFMVARYPDSAYVNRPSYNMATAKRKVIQYEWRVRETAQDLVRLDSIRGISAAQEAINTQLKESITVRDAFISTQAEIITENDSTVSILLQRENTWKVESDAWKGTAQKYRRQRDLVIAGAVVVIGGGIATLIFLR